MDGYIYKIISKQTCNFYIGSSKTIDSRWRWHRNKLRNNKHHNIHLQRIYNKYGEEDLSYHVLEMCLVENMLQLEQSYIDRFKANSLFLNVAQNAGGGDTISKHPDRKKIINKISLSSKKRYEKGLVSKEFLISQGRFKPGVDHSGKNNSMYGKKHRQDTRAKIGYKTYLRTKFTNDIEKQVLIEYNNGTSIKDLSKQYKCTVNKINTLLKYNANKPHSSNTTSN